MNGKDGDCWPFTAKLVESFPKRNWNVFISFTDTVRPFQFRWDYFYLMLNHKLLGWKNPANFAIDIFHLAPNFQPKVESSKFFQDDRSKMFLSYIVTGLPISPQFLHPIFGVKIFEVAEVISCKLPRSVSEFTLRNLMIVDVFSGKPVLGLRSSDFSLLSGSTMWQVHYTRFSQPWTRLLSFIQLLKRVTPFLENGTLRLLFKCFHIDYRCLNARSWLLVEKW